MDEKELKVFHPKRQKLRQLRKFQRTEENLD